MSNLKSEVQSIKAQFKSGDLLYLDAIQELEKIAYPSVAAEVMVEEWFEELQNGDLS